MKRLVVIFRWHYAMLATFFGFVVILASVTNVPTRLQPEDNVAIKAILEVQKKPDLDGFDDEIDAIRWTQARVFKVAPDMVPIPDYSNREPMDLLKAKTGLCYDRSRALDKALQWLGFETRHVYILFADPGDTTGVDQFLVHALSRSLSHAVTEVKTSRGWLMVDSNVRWISLSRNGQPVPAGQVHDRRSELDNLPEWGSTPFWAIRGMYSRKGQLYRPFLPFPELNWLDFLGWVTGLK